MIADKEFEHTIKTNYEVGYQGALISGLEDRE